MGDVRVPVKSVVLGNDSTPLLSCSGGGWGKKMWPLPMGGNSIQVLWCWGIIKVYSDNLYSRSPGPLVFHFEKDLLVKRCRCNVLLHQAHGLMSGV